MNFRLISQMFRAALLLGACVGSSLWAQGKLLSNFASNTVTTPHVRAELMVYAPDGVQPGKPLTFGLQLQHQQGWHTYWKNPGDSGLPIQLTWTLPSELAAGAIDWPVPKKIPVGNLMNYGFEGAVLLMVPVTVQAAVPEGQTHLTIELKAQWLVCKTECIPEEGEFVFKLPVRGSTALNRGLFDNAKNALPKTYGESVRFELVDQTLKLSLDKLPTAWRGKTLEVFPEDTDIIETAAKQVQTWTGGVWTATLPLSKQRSSSPSKMAWLVKIAGGQSNPAVRIDAALSGAWPPASAAKPAAPSPALEAALAQNLEAQNKSNSSTEPLVSWVSATFWCAVLGAMLGGLILNLMPCVLPVLAIKLLSFAPKKVMNTTSSVARIRFEHTMMPVIHSDHTLSFRASSGLFALGVIGTFVLLGAALLALRAAGQSLGWGFQLQSPGMVVGLAVLFLLIGLNLFDAFELRAILPTRWANFQSNNPSIEAIASGALAVLVATPCTAPFMGASLGLAIALPAPQALLIFMALGIGMALPFIAITLVPAIGSWLLQALPKPGQWMLVLRHFLAWPVFATVIWLLWIYAQQTNINSTFSLMFALLMVVGVVWAINLKAGWLRRAAILTLVLSLAASFFLMANTSAQLPAKPSAQAPSDGAWLAWSATAQQTARAQGRPVFVDFTAAWCITCQINKSSTLGQPRLMALMKSKNVLLLRADWTKPNAAIAAELTRLGRSGLPVYAFYLPGSPEPQLLPEVLTTGLIEDALSVL